MLKVEQACVNFGKREVLKGVDLPEPGPGTIVGLIGPNAAGKSTLVKTIAGIQKLTSGTCDTGDATVGYVPQDLLTSASLTAFESVVISAKRGSANVLESAVQALEKLGIVHLAHRYVHQLSGGQCQLVAVAQMLAREPELMLLDEPTSALDLRHQVHLLDTLRKEVSRGAVALVAIHDLNLAARYCDELVVLHGGRVHAHGTPAEVLNTELLGEVYGIRARVIDDEGVPMVCPVEANFSKLEPHEPTHSR
ncbi:ABC transporter ATP-binding protein [Corynebacterium striatum]|uniref:ABC transporter ATP-binding protein n=1 Tax=Corynebacterium striatum TaxID=43770 RepID=UPI003F683A07